MLPGCPCACVAMCKCMKRSECHVHVGQGDVHHLPASVSASVAMCGGACLFSFVLVASVLAGAVRGQGRGAGARSTQAAGGVCKAVAGVDSGGDVLHAAGAAAVRGGGRGGRGVAAGPQRGRALRPRPLLRQAHGEAHPPAHPPPRAPPTPPTHSPSPCQVAPWSTAVSTQLCLWRIVGPHAHPERAAIRSCCNPHPRQQPCMPAVLMGTCLRSWSMHMVVCPMLRSDQISGAGKGQPVRVPGHRCMLLAHAWCGRAR